MALRSNEEIDGLTIKQIRNLLNQFADDMDIFSICNEKSIKAILEELEGFRRHSGFTVSYDKTTLYRIGSLRHSNAQMYDLDEYIWSNRDIKVLGVTIAHEDLLSKNYDSILEKARTILNTWYHRGLSLLGRVQVVNTLIASLFVYKMMVLPIIPRHIVRNMDNVIREFLWNKKKSKIAYNILQNPKKEGGLNLVNLTNKDKALKATWPQILSNEQDYAQMVYGIMRCSSLKENIWRCRIHPTDVASMKFNSLFWREALMCWCEYNYYRNTRTENQIIWYNSNIKVGGKLIWWRDLYESGLIFVHQLFSNRRFKTIDEMQEEFSISVMRYNSLKRAVCKEYKEYFTGMDKLSYMPLPPHNYDLCINVFKGNLSRIVYASLMDDVMIIHSKFLKWRQDLGQDFSAGIVDFGLLHKDIFCVTNVPKYRSFQYRLLQRGLVTNVQLFKWGILPHQECHFCKNEAETIIHLMVHCEIVQEIWSGIGIFIEQKFHTQVTLSPENIIFNRIVKKKDHVANLICLITKQYIYRQRCMSGSVVLNVLKEQIRSVESIEKYIAIKNGRSSKHALKWGGELI